MPTLPEHKTIAAHNHDFVDAMMRQPAFSDWAITGMFYCTVHLIEMVLAKNGIDSPDHNFRDGCIHKMDTLKSIYRQYRGLQDASVGARYYGDHFDTVTLTGKYLPMLEAIERHIFSMGL